jgi:hypothetical protein
VGHARASWERMVVQQGRWDLGHMENNAIPRVRVHLLELDLM